MQVNLNNLEIDYWIKHWINYTYNHLLNIIGHWESAKATLDYAKYMLLLSKDFKDFILSHQMVNRRKLW